MSHFKCGKRKHLFFALHDFHVSSNNRRFLRNIAEASSNASSNRQSVAELASSRGLNIVELASKHGQISVEVESNEEFENKETQNLPKVFNCRPATCSFGARSVPRGANIDMPGPSNTFWEVQEFSFLCLLKFRLFSKWACFGMLPRGALSGGVVVAERALRAELVEKLGSD